MSSKDFNIFVVIHPEKDEPIAEIYYKQEEVAEVFLENKQFILNLFPSSSASYWEFSLGSFQDCLDDAKRRLMGQ